MGSGPPWQQAAIVGRPLLAAAMGEAASHANPTTLYLPPQPAAGCGPMPRVA
jgi:hypothetical protein